ncbi:MAG TPA: protein-L-isoaspartate(D-aspartate) O-methyltransferase [Gammaproteobacteria bacterium]|nr:protein-L-isoaspartate(D-aspartate) O-methyltransferase [Gammaproteobacteria bacterium]
MSHWRGIGFTSQRARDRLVLGLRDAGICNEAVLEVMRVTPRHLFVDEALASRAYDNIALPIGLGQTISQPYTVARMTQSLLEGGPARRVLEIGTGSGYQCAILAQLLPEVYTVERLAELVAQARRRFHSLRLRNIRIRHGDGTQGWPEQAPFDAILATAAPECVPAPLLEQLVPGGRLIIPVGQSGQQRLEVYTRTAEGYERDILEAVSFVPMRSGGE